MQRRIAEKAVGVAIQKEVQGIAQFFTDATAGHTNAIAQINPGIIVGQVLA
jgi:hypothetical protein